MNNFKSEKKRTHAIHFTQLNEVTNKKQGHCYWIAPN